jgi:hypothetical protein
VICRLEAELRRPVQRWPETVLMRLQQAILYSHPMESNPSWAQTGVTMLSRINLHRVRAQYQPAVRLEQPLLVFCVSREMPNGGQFQGQTCSVSCEDFKNIYIWYPDQDQSIEIWRLTKSSVISHRDFLILPAPTAHATRSNKRPPNRMVYSLRTRVRREYTVLLVFLLVFYFKFSVEISILNILQVNTSELPVRDDI